MTLDFVKIGIYLAVVTVGYFVWRLVLPFVFSGIGRALGAHKMVPLPSADLRDDPRALAALRAPPASAAAAARGGFDRAAVVSVGGDWEEAARLNAMLAGLSTQRQTRVAREGALRSRVAWKVAVFRQAALYRLVALAAGSAADWNVRNVLGAALQARGVLEAAALLADFDRRLQGLSSAGDLAGIDALVTERGFASPLDGPAGSGPQPGFNPALIEAGRGAGTLRGAVRPVRCRRARPVPGVRGVGKGRHRRDLRGRGRLRAWPVRSCARRSCGACGSGGGAAGH